MSGRYATIITDDEGREVVSQIAQYEGNPSPPREGSAKLIKVADGVKIGMVKGGKLESVGGFGFEAGSGLAKASPKQQDAATKKTATKS